MWHFKIVRTAVMALAGYGLIVYWFVADRGPRIEISQALIFGVLLAAVETVMLVQRLRNTNWGGFSPLSRALGCLLCLAIGGLWLYSAGRTEADGARMVGATVTSCSTQQFGRKTATSSCSLALDDGTTAASADGTHPGDEGRRIDYLPDEQRVVLPSTDRVTYLVLAGAAWAFALSGLVAVLITVLRPPTPSQQVVITRTRRM